MVLLGDGAEHGIGLDELDLGGEELIGVGNRGRGGFLAHDAGGHAAVDIHDGSGFVDGGEALGDDVGADHAGEDEGRDLPAVALEDPEIVGERERGRFRFRIRSIPASAVHVTGDGEIATRDVRRWKESRIFSHFSPLGRPG